MKPQLIIPYAALAFALCAAGIAILETRERKDDTFSYKSEPGEGSELILRLYTQDGGREEVQHLRFEKGSWRVLRAETTNDK